MIKLIELKDLLYIDSSIPNGLRWKMPRGTVKPHQAVGCLKNSSGYYSAKIKGKDYSNHRLIYSLYYNLELSDLPKCIDHADRNKQNNAPENLRPATKQQNGGNSNKRSKTSSRYKGVSWISRDNKWQTKIQYNGKNNHIGYFDSEVEAARAYDEQALKLFGEFANLNFLERNAIR